MKTLWIYLLLVLLLARVALAQDPPIPTPTALDTPTLATPFPVADIASTLDATQSVVDEISARMEQDTTNIEIDGPLAALIQDVDRRSGQLGSKLKQSPTLADLRDSEREWTDLAAAMPAWKRELNRRNRELEADLNRLDQLEQSWKITLEAESRSGLPGELLDRIRSAVRQLEALKDRASRSQANLLVLLTRLSSVDSKVQETLASLTRARKERVGKILNYDADPIWKADFRKLQVGALTRETLASLQAQLQALEDYRVRNSARFLYHLLCFGMLYLGLRWARRRVTPWAEQEPTLRRPADVFNTPLTTALLLSVVMGDWFYPQPPPLLQALLGAAGLLPALAVLRRLLPQHLHATLYMLVLLFCVDELRTITAPQLLLTRLLFTAEIAVASVYLLYRYGSYRKLYPDTLAQRARLLAAAIFSCCLVAVNLGYVGLAYTAGEATLDGIYLAVFLSSVVQIMDGMIMLMLRTPPLSLLASVRGHRQLYRQRLQNGVRYLAGLLWVISVLDLLGIRQSLLETVTAALGWTLKLGAVQVTLGGFLGLALALWIPYQLSRLVRFLLEQDVYPHVKVSRGATYTLSTVTHYLLLVGGGLFGLAAIGIDMTKFAIVASALGVGIGFGLQNIVNNFVSGIILLFERPIEVGHVIDVSGQTGTLQSIGLRASVLRTIEGSEVIIPNGELLSTRVTNWTLSDQRRLLKVVVGVEYGSSSAQVKEILLGVARSHPRVQQSPPVEVLFLDLGESSLDFELRAWTADFETWMTTRSDLVSAVYDALNAAGIGIPFPQRSLHVESWPQPPQSQPLPVAEATERVPD